MSEPCPRDWRACYRSYCARNERCAEDAASAPAVAPKEATDAERAAFALRGHIRTLRLSGRDDGFVEDIEKAAALLATQPAAPAEPSFDDPAVRQVYQLLVESNAAPPLGEHWEAWIARKIVASLAAPPQAVVKQSLTTRAMQAEPPKPAEIRRNDDGSLDELVGTGLFHLEQMSDSHWWMSLDTEHGQVTVNLTAKGRITAAVEEAKETKP
jgi:hypothetical protein